MESRLADYERRLEEVKRLLQSCVSERESQLKRARECEDLLGEMGAWLRGGVVQLEGLRVMDPRCSAIGDQQAKCQVYKY